MTEGKCCSVEGKGKCGGGLVCPLTGFRIAIKLKMIIAMGVTALVFNVVQWVWNHKVMADLYTANPTLFRPDADMGIVIGALSFMAAVFAYIFMKGHEGAGCREGVRFGIIMTLFLASNYILICALSTVPSEVVHMWIAGTAVTFILAGVVLNMIAKRGNCCG